MIRKALAAVCCVCAVSAGCYSSTTGTTATQACTDLANATCNLFSQCSNGWYIAQQYGDLPTCISRYLTNCENRLSVPGAQSAAQTEACAQALPSETCADLYGNNPVAACRAPDGGAAAAAVCTINAQCQSAYCAVPRNELCGTCANPPAMGDDCSQLLCGPGLICLRGPMTCSSPVTDGGVCLIDSDCQYGLACLDPFTDGGNCVPGGALGTECDLARRTGLGCPARLGLSCQKIEPDGGACKALQPADAGQACGNVNGVGTACIQSGLCQKAQPDAGQGICLGYAADGTACDSDAGPQCLPLAKCVWTSDGGTVGICIQPASMTCQ